MASTSMEIPTNSLASISSLLQAWRETGCDVAASIIGSAACTYAGQPFDTLKVRVQVSSVQSTSWLQTLRLTVRNEGLLALWQGSLPAFMGSLAENAVAFALNGVLKRYLSRENEPQSHSRPFALGAITGFCTALVLCPCDVLKCRLQVEAARSQRSVGMLLTAQRVIQSRGLLGLWAGLEGQLLRDVPFYASFFGSYDLLCSGLQQHYPSLSSTTVYFIAGGLAGQLGWLASIAPDTIKSRMQTSEAPAGLISTARAIVAQRGLRGLFLGVEVAILRAFPANAALFVGYESSRKVFSSL